MEDNELEPAKPVVDEDQSMSGFTTFIIVLFAVYALAASFSKRRTLFSACSKADQEGG